MFHAILVSSLLLNPLLVSGQEQRKSKGRVLFSEDYTSNEFHGNRATLGQFPWEVEIECARRICTGSLINSNFVLTSAHCILDAKSCSLTIGHVFRNKSSQQGNFYKSVKDLYMHPLFNRNDNIDAFDARSRFNIALIKLPVPVEKADNVLPINIIPADKNRSFHNHSVTVIGWANLNKNEAALRYANLTILFPAACKQYYPQFTLYQHMYYCAVAARHSVFTGYSGGPMFFYDRYDDPLQLAVTSYRAKTNGKRIPQAFIRIVPHLPWIEHIMSGNVSNRTLAKVNLEPNNFNADKFNTTSTNQSPTAFVYFLSLKMYWVLHIWITYFIVN